MAKVYQHQLHAHKYRRPHPWRWTFGILIVLMVATYAGLRSLDSETEISKPKTVTTTLRTENDKVTYTKGSFTIELPKGWQFTSKQQDIYTIYHFKSAQGGEDGNRSMDIYEDSPPKNFAVNRMIPVTPNEEGGLTTDVSLVSDNCTAYTTGATDSRKTVGQLARWQGIDFICDMANPLRNTVGTGSKDGLNTVIIKTATSRPHNYFFTYTDSNATPDYNIFADAINSFKVIE